MVCACAESEIIKNNGHMDSVCPNKAVTVGTHNGEHVFMYLQYIVHCLH